MIVKITSLTDIQQLKNQKFAIEHSLNQSALDNSRSKKRATPDEVINALSFIVIIEKLKKINQHNDVTSKFHPVAIKLICSNDEKFYQALNALYKELIKAEPSGEFLNDLSEALSIPNDTQNISNTHFPNKIRHFKNQIYSIACTKSLIENNETIIQQLPNGEEKFSLIAPHELFKKKFDLYQNFNALIEGDHFKNELERFHLLVKNVKNKDECTSSNDTSAPVIQTQNHEYHDTDYIDKISIQLRDYMPLTYKFDEHEPIMQVKYKNKIFNFLITKKPIENNSVDHIIILEENDDMQYVCRSLIVATLHFVLVVSGDLKVDKSLYNIQLDTEIMYQLMLHYHQKNRSDTQSGIHTGYQLTQTTISAGTQLTSENIEQTNSLHIN